MLVKLDHPDFYPTFIDASRIIAVSVEDNKETGEFEVSVETHHGHNGFVFNFLDIEDAQAWADQVAQIVNDATTPSLDVAKCQQGITNAGMAQLQHEGFPMWKQPFESFENWLPTKTQLEQAAQRVPSRFHIQHAGNDDILSQVVVWLDALRHVFRETQSQTQGTNHA